MMVILRMLDAFGCAATAVGFKLKGLGGLNRPDEVGADPVIVFEEFSP
jgi:hypothetical protein